MGFEHETYALLQAEEQVHVMHSHCGGAFHEIVDSHRYHELLAYLLKIDYGLVGAEHFGDAGGGVGEECETVVVVVILIEFYGLFF